MAPPTCVYVFPRKVVRCGAPADVVLDLGFNGWGACREHAGKVLLWALEDSSRVTAKTPLADAQDREHEDSQ